MGGKPSVEYDNDFELVVRSTKELEWLLVTHFHAPDGSRDNTCGLHEKITAATHQGRPLSDDLKRRMRKIVSIRNKLVHDRNYNALESRAGYARDYQQIKQELMRMAGPAPQAGGCCVS